MYLTAERNDIGLGHASCLVTNMFRVTALRLLSAAILTKAIRVVMFEADVVRADPIGNYVEFIVTIWDVRGREAD